MYDDNKTFIILPYETIVSFWNITLRELAQGCHYMANKSLSQPQKQ